MRLSHIISALDCLQGRAPLPMLCELLEALDLDDPLVTSSISFHEHQYARNVLHRTARYEILLLCWLPGQRSPIHDHARSTCGVRVLQGVATEIRYAEGFSGELRPVEIERVSRGSVAGSQDADIHEIVNEGDSPLVTLHVYSPPLDKMTTYPRDRLFRATGSYDRTLPVAGPVS